ncbi:D-3-phosphoglycerate dehydrogenase [Gammaproteobacteria bacterium]|nr:D-3-phosphoglycerate dehydrogenase [Gammaproteobacteria bacterium]
MKKTSYPKKEIKIVLFEGIHPKAVDMFKEEGYVHIETYAKALEGAELIAAVKGAHIIGLRSRTFITDDVLKHADKLMAIGCFCIGTNQVDLAAANKLAIPVFNAPYSNTRSVAELVIAEAIMLMRLIPLKSAICHQGGWSKSAEGSWEVRGKTLGIVGYGHIGSQVGVLAESMGMLVKFYDVEPKLSLGNAKYIASLDELLAQSDMVTLHVPELASTNNLMSCERLQKMKQGAVLINASRGSVVDIDALAQLLISKHLNGAAIDVFPVEPTSNNEEFISPLRGLDNVILTPHVGGSTIEAQENIGLEVAAKLIRYSDNGSTLSAVNFPEVSLPLHPNAHRVLHIHENIPGILSSINELISARTLNIVSQFLQTSGTVGYVVVDVEGDVQEALALHQDMRKIKGTLKSRILY